MEHPVEEEGVVLDPLSISTSLQPAVNDQHERDPHHIDQIYLRGTSNLGLAWNMGNPVGYVGGQNIGNAIELRRM